MKKIYSIIYCTLAALLLAGCHANEGSNDSGNQGGQGGSMACFTIVGDYLYMVDDRSLKLTSLHDPLKPVHVNKLPLSRLDVIGDIETIFHYDGMLFLGSRSAMYILDISGDPKMPKLISKTNHFRSCDPVVAYGDRAYVTLNNARINCGWGGDHILTYDISGIIKENENYGKPVTLLPGGDYNLFTGDIHPAGLGVDGAAGRLFVCTNKGVMVFELSDDPEKPIVLLSDLSDVPGVGIIDAYDVITRGGHLIVTGQSGVYQFDYTEEEIRLLSKIDLRR